MSLKSSENLGIARKLLLELIQHFPAERVVWGTEIEVTDRWATGRIPALLTHNEELKAAIANEAGAGITRRMPPPVELFS